jgi:hypothetical protein
MHDDPDLRIDSFAKKEPCMECLTCLNGAWIFFDGLDAISPTLKRPQFHDGLYMPGRSIVVLW